MDAVLIFQLFRLSKRHHVYIYVKFINSQKFIPAETCPTLPISLGILIYTGEILVRQSFYISFIQVKFYFISFLQFLKLKEFMNFICDFKTDFEYHKNGMNLQHFPGTQKKPNKASTDQLGAVDCFFSLILVTILFAAYNTMHNSNF